MKRSPLPPVDEYGAQRRSKQIAVVRNEINWYPSSPKPPVFQHGLNPNVVSGAINYGEQAPNTDDFSPIVENGDHNPWDAPLSTFSIDVDQAAYSIVRFHINNRRTVPKDAAMVSTALAVGTSFGVTNFDSRFNGIETSTAVT